jgi:beta-hydroxylase
MSVQTRSYGRHARRIAFFAVLVAPAIYFAPIPAVILLACGVLDVSRHRKISYQLIEEYFTGKGLLTWLLSPINLLADLLSRKPRGAVPFEQLPAQCRQEIETCVAAFVGNRIAITEAIRPHMESDRRAMLAFRWFDAPMTPPIRVAAFEQDFRYVKTIAVSTFRGRTDVPHRSAAPDHRAAQLDPIDSSDVHRGRRPGSPLSAEPLLIRRHHVPQVGERRYAALLPVRRHHPPQPVSRRWRSRWTMSLLAGRSGRCSTGTGRS